MRFSACYANIGECYRYSVSYRAENGHVDYPARIELEEMARAFDTAFHPRI